MTDLVSPSTPKQLKTMVTLLNLVKGELFITLDHAERCLEMFISERQSNATLQQFIQALQQIRGTLMLIEIPGGSQLTELMLQRTLEIPTAADKTWDITLTAISTAIFTLRRYLENFETYSCPLPELLLPAINDLRATNKQPPLPDSYFTNIIVMDISPPNSLPEQTDNNLFSRLRQMYQIGLLGLIKDENKETSLKMMSRSMDRLQKHLNNEDASRLCWITSAALEAFSDSNMSAFMTRKRLFCRVDQQLRNTQINNEEVNQVLLKDLLYLISLDNALGIKALNVFNSFELTPLPYNNTILEAEIIKLAGPGQETICSLTTAIREELLHTQTTIDSFIHDNTNHQDLIKVLLNNLEHLIKTLSLIELKPAETMLKGQLNILQTHKNERILDTSILDNLADIILYVEGVIINYETNASCEQNKKIITTFPEHIEESNQYFKQGCALAIQESLTGIASAQQNIMAYIESRGDKQYLEKLPQILDEIYSCLLFLNQHRTARIIRQCKYYIDSQMIQRNNLPDTQQLDNLADILTSLEFFMETNNLSSTIEENQALDLAEESLATLNMPIQHTPPLNTSSAEQTVIDTNFTEPSTDLTMEQAVPVVNQTTEMSPTMELTTSLNSISNETQEIDSRSASQVPPLTKTMSSFTLTPVENESKEHIEDTTEQAISKQKEENVDEDDIKFTSPANWTLS